MSVKTETYKTAGNFITLEILWEVFEELNQKLVTIISTVPAMMSLCLDRLCLKYVNEETSAVKFYLTRQRKY